MHFRRFARPAWLALLVLAGSLWQGTDRFMAGSLGVPTQAQVSGQKYPKHILLIRHAEKLGVKDDSHLSDAGKARAKQLPLLFVKTQTRPEPLPIPDFIFAASDSKNSQRPRETVIQLAMKLKLPIDDNFQSTAKDPKAKGALELSDELLKKPKYVGKTILISWRHSKLPELARTLKAENAPMKWGDDVYDRVWKITYDDAGKAEFADLPQRLMPGDSAK